MKIFLVRHAESQDRVEKRKQTPKTPLSDLGQRQAQAIADRMAIEQIDEIITSPLLRTLQTAEAISAKLTMPVTKLTLLREKEEPNLYGLPYSDPRHTAYIAELTLHAHDIDWTFEGKGESYRTVLGRAQQLHDLLLKKHQNKNLLLVTHGYLIGCLLTVCLLGPHANDAVKGHFLQSLNLKNSGLTELNFDEITRKWRIILLNDHLHTRSLT